MFLIDDSDMGMKIRKILRPTDDIQLCHSLSTIG